MRIIGVLVCLLGLSGVVIADSELKPYAANPWYWSYAGEPILLRGASDDDNLFQWSNDALTAHLDLLVSVGGNYVRNTMSDRDEGNIQAFAKTGDGTFDLDRWNEAYWDRLEFFLEETKKRGIVVQLTLWDVFDRDRESDVFAGVLADTEAFYATVAENNEAGLRYQRRFVDRLLATTFDYGHVLYNIDNESRWEAAWENYWASYLHAAAKKAGRRIHVTTMQFDPGNSVRAALTFPELYDFIEISQNSQDSRGARGHAHWENILFWRRHVLAARGPTPMSNVKIYGAGSGELVSAGTEAEAVNRFWRNVFAGSASSRFHRPASGWGSGLNERVQTNLRAMQMFLDEFDLFAATPNNGVLRQVVPTTSSAMEAYALTQVGKAYAVFFPRGRYLVGLDPWVYAESVSVRWLNIDTLEWSELETVGLEWEGHQEDWGDRTQVLLKTPGNESYIALIEIIDEE